MSPWRVIAHRQPKSTVQHDHHGPSGGLHSRTFYLRSVIDRPPPSPSPDKCNHTPSGRFPQRASWRLEAVALIPLRFQRTAAGRPYLRRCRTVRVRQPWPCAKAHGQLRSESSRVQPAWVRSGYVRELRFALAPLPGILLQRWRRLQARHQLPSKRCALTARIYGVLSVPIE